MEQNRQKEKEGKEEGERGIWRSPWEAPQCCSGGRNSAWKWKLFAGERSHNKVTVRSENIGKLKGQIIWPI